MGHDGGQVPPGGRTTDGHVRQVQRQGRLAPPKHPQDRLPGVVDGGGPRVFGSQAVVGGDDHVPRPAAHVGAHGVLGVDVAQHPAAAVVVDHDGPAGGRGFAFGGETSDLDVVGARSLLTFEPDVLGLADGEGISATRDEFAPDARSRDRLQMNLLGVDDVFVVEFDVLRVKAVLDRVVEGVWWLCVCQRHD